MISNPLSIHIFWRVMWQRAIALTSQVGIHLAKALSALLLPIAEKADLPGQYGGEMPTLHEDFLVDENPTI